MSLDHFSILMTVTDSVLLAVRRTTTRHIAWLKTRRMILLLGPDSESGCQSKGRGEGVCHP